jgi:hypothetical protein
MTTTSFSNSVTAVDSFAGVGAAAAIVPSG